MTEELKKALESAKTEEEKKAVAEKFKNEIQKLDPEELDKVAGGVVKIKTCKWLVSPPRVQQSDL